MPFKITWTVIWKHYNFYSPIFLSSWHLNLRLQKSWNVKGMKLPWNLNLYWNAEALQKILSAGWRWTPTPEAVPQSMLDQSTAICRKLRLFQWQEIIFDHSYEMLPHYQGYLHYRTKEHLLCCSWQRLWYKMKGHLILYNIVPKNFLKIENRLNEIFCWKYKARCLL